METYRVNEDQGAGKLCYTSNSRRATIQIVTRDKTALGEFYQLVGSYTCSYNHTCDILNFQGNFDYVPVNKTISFDGSEPSQCVDILIVNDELTEGDESFAVDVMTGNVLLSSTNVIISGNSECIRSCLIENGTMHYVILCSWSYDTDRVIFRGWWCSYCCVCWCRWGGGDYCTDITGHSINCDSCEEEKRL